MALLGNPGPLCWCRQISSLVPPLICQSPKKPKLTQPQVGPKAFWLSSATVMDTMDSVIDCICLFHSPPLLGGSPQKVVLLFSGLRYPSFPLLGFHFGPWRSTESLFPDILWTAATAASGEWGRRDMKDFSKCWLDTCMMSTHSTCPGWGLSRAG